MKVLTIAIDLVFCSLIYVLNLMLFPLMKPAFSLLLLLLLILYIGIFVLIYSGAKYWVWKMLGIRIRSFMAFFLLNAAMGAILLGVVLLLLWILQKTGQRLFMVGIIVLLVLAFYPFLHLMQIHRSSMRVVKKNILKVLWMYGVGVFAFALFVLFIRTFAVGAPWVKYADVALLLLLLIYNAYNRISFVSMARDAG